MKRIIGCAAAAALLVSLAGCGSDEASGGDGGSKGTTKLTVFAAASLEPTFTELGKKFAASHKGVTVRFNFAGSSDLAAQLKQGAPADVFASADPENMDKVVDDDLIEGDPVNFASNTLEIAVPPDNPGDVSSLKDLSGPDLKVVVCAPKVPCGSAAEKVEKAADLTIDPVSEEQSVTDVLSKVETGEADAGLVYVTDVKDAGDKVKGVKFSASSAAVNVYPIGTIISSEQQDVAGQFLDLVTSDQGQAVMTDAGFAKP